MNEIMSLEELLERYAPESSDLGEAIIKAELDQFELMKEYPDGVPSGVMYTASMTGTEWIAQLVAAMLVELRSLVEKWGEEETMEQEQMTKGVFHLLRVHATNTVLSVYKPGGEEDETS